MRERWLPVVGFPGYLVSDKGRLKSVGRFVEAIMEAVRDGFVGSNVTRVCMGERGYHKGYRWRFAETP